MTDREARQRKIEAAFKARHEDPCALARVLLPEIMGAPRASDRDYLAEFVVRTFGYPSPGAFGHPSSEALAASEPELSEAKGLTPGELEVAEAVMGEIVQAFLGSVREGNGTAAEFGARLVGLLASCASVHERIYALGMVLDSDVVPFVQIAEGDFADALDAASSAEVGRRAVVAQSVLVINRIFGIKGRTHGQRFAAVRRVLARHRGVEFDYLLRVFYEVQLAYNHNNRRPTNLDIVVLGGPGGGVMDLGALLGGQAPNASPDANGRGLLSSLMHSLGFGGGGTARGRQDGRKGDGAHNGNGHGGNGSESRDLFAGRTAAQIKRFMLNASGMSEALFAQYIAHHEGGQSCPAGHDCLAHGYIRLRDAEAAAASDGGAGDSRAKDARTRV